MKELFDLSFSAVNFIPTLLFCLTLVYWVIVAVGMLDIGSFDFDLDLDTDVDVDIDGSDMEGAPESSLLWLNRILVFFNLGKVPFMVFWSFWTLPMWVLSMEVNSFLGNTSFLLGLVVLIPIMLVSLFFAKYCTIPFVKLFAKLEDAPLDSDDMIGKVCTMLTKTSSKGLGQGEVDIDGTAIILYTKTQTGIEISSGKTALVIQHFPEKEYYLVEPYP